MDEIKIEMRITAPELVNALVALAKVNGEWNNISKGLGFDTNADIPLTTQDETKVVEVKTEAVKAEEVKSEKAIFTIADIRAEFKEFAKKKGSDKAKEVLSEFGASKVTDLPEDKYNAVMDRLKELI